MQIEMMNINDIYQSIHNTKEHPDWQVQQIADSIEEFGFNDPISIDEENMIIAGHGRHLAALQLGYTEVPVIRLNNLSDEQKRAYIIVHNQLTLNTNFDLEKLQKELDEIKDIDMADYGFSDLDDLLADFVADEITNDKIKRTKKKHVCPMCQHEFED